MDVCRTGVQGEARCADSTALFQHAARRPTGGRAGGALPRHQRRYRLDGRRASVSGCNVILVQEHFDDRVRAGSFLTILSAVRAVEDGSADMTSGRSHPRKSARVTLRPDSLRPVQARL